MTTAIETASPTTRPQTRSIKPDAARAPHYIWHPAFPAKSAAVQFAAQSAPNAEQQSSLGYLPDDETRDIVRRMHYAAYRADKARTAQDRAEWKQSYFNLRDRVVLGNRKLVFRAIRKNSLVHQMADDLIGECDIIMIRAVAAYNPWIGVRFSTYAFTCLMRGLARLSRRVAAKRMLNFMPLDAAAEQSLGALDLDSPIVSDLKPIEAFLQAGDPLLTGREKMVLKRRFGLSKECERSTLETVGADLGISKERVRQVQTSALTKLRQALDAI